MMPRKTPCPVLLLLLLGLLAILPLPVRHAGAEQPFAQERIFLDTILRAAPAGIGMVHNRIISQVNDYILTLTGYSREELVGKSARILYPSQEEFDRVGLEKYHQIARKGTGSVETVWLRKDGTLRHVILSSTPLIPGQLDYGVTFTVIDITDRITAETKLREREERFHALFHNHAAVMLLVDPETGNILDANEAAVKFYGWSREELTRMRTLDINTLTPEELKREMQKAKTHARTYFDFRHRRADGSIRNVAVFSAGIPLEGKTILFSIIHDITDQKAAEAALATRTSLFIAGLAFFIVLLAITVLWLVLGQRQIRKSARALEASERKYRELFENAPVGIFHSTPEGRYLAANPEYARILGYESADAFMAAGKNAVEFYVRPEDRQGFKEKIQRDGFVRDYEIEFKRTDGKTVWGVKHSTCDRDARGGVVFNGFLFDITQRKQGEEAIKESEERYRLLFSKASDAIMLLEPDGRIIDCNEKTLEMFDYPEEAFIGKTPADFSPEFQGEETSAQAAMRRINAVLDEGAQAFEWRHCRRDGTLFDAEVSLNRIKIGEKIVIQAILRNITARKQAEEERERLQAQLVQAQKMESVGRLAGGVAHDFNNMLGVILGYTELALLLIPEEEKLSGYLKEIEKAARRSADLTGQLLAFARRQAVAPKVLDLNRTLEATLKMIERLIGENISLDFKPNENIWAVRMDPSQLDQVLTNLAVNARDAIEGVGKVIIETANVTMDEAYCARHAGCLPGDYVLLTVADDGRGMDAETMSHLFEPFFTTKEKGRGTGLGLATIYGIIKQNCGFINVYSEAGYGSTFKIYLPRYRSDADAGPEEERSREVAAGKGETILLVEDEPLLLAMTKDMLELCDYAVIAGSNPGAALRLAREYRGPIDLLVTDVIMPEMNGRELASEMLSIHPELKILFMSGYTENVIAHHGVLDDGIHFLEKPFTLASLSAKVREALAGKNRR